MNLGNNLELIQSQKLIMTTQLKQSLKILSMSKLELDEEIEKEAQVNPLLDIEKGNEINWEEYIRSVENLNYKEKNIEKNYTEVNFENMIKYSSNLYEDLILQINLYDINPKEKEICKYLIGCLDEDGYLRMDEKDLITILSIDMSTFEKCLSHIWNLEPNGVGARNISECLIIQLHNLGIYEETLEKIIATDLELIAKNKYKEISKKYHISLDKCIHFIGMIKNLDPKPGRSCSNEKSVYIEPDIIVEKIDNEFVVYLNEKDNYKLRINNYYKDILKNSDDDAKEFIKNRLDSAAGLMKNIESRKSTVLKIAKEIVYAQNDFFEKGAKYIKPLKMKDVAEKLGFHESTISRGVKGKYMLTPFGMYEFRGFFSSGIENNNTDVSSTSIKRIIQDMVKNEDKKKPLSDEFISKLLKEKGICVARRTVAKYREELNIASSSKRKIFEKIN
jgi:RNA polymerase sigma-54 factor